MVHIYSAATSMVAGHAMGMEPSGQELLLIVVEDTFCTPTNADVRLY